MTKPQRSTRRSVNPPEGEQPPKELKGRPQNLAEVESILDEIENLVSNKGKDSEETAVSTPVFEDKGLPKVGVESHDESDPDIGRLEEELHSAIATEFEKRSDEKIRKNETDHSIPEDEITRLAEVFEEAEEKQSRSGRTPRHEIPLHVETDPQGEGESIQETSRNGDDSLILRFLTRPMRNLTPGMRLAVNITAITLALWVPIIWLIAMNGGFGPQGAMTGIDPDPITTEISIPEPGKNPVESP